MAAKRKRKSFLSTWIALAVALTIAVVAVVSLLSDRRLFSSSLVHSERDEEAGTRNGDLIDQDSRDKLREILRAANDGD